MSSTRNPFAFGKPITPDTLGELFAHHRGLTGGWSMTVTPPEPDPPGQPDPPAEPQRPEGVSEDEWAALGDPGKRAIARERERAEAAERALAASRAKPAPPKSDPPKPDPPKPQDPPKPNDQTPDVAAIVQQAVEAALKPLQEREEQRAAQDAAQQIQNAVIEAARPLLHDATDALANVDLTSVVNDQGAVDEAKVKTALDDLVKRKPHLAKATQRVAPPGIGGGAPATTPDAEQVKKILADMQAATGVRPATAAPAAH